MQKMKVFMTTKLQHGQNGFNPAAIQGKYLVPIFPSLSPFSSQPTFNLIHCHTIPCIFFPCGCPKFSFGYQQREQWFPVYKDDSQKGKWEHCFFFHEQHTLSVSLCPLWSACMCGCFTHQVRQCTKLVLDGGQPRLSMKAVLLVYWLLACVRFSL